MGCEVLHGCSLGVPDGAGAPLLWVSWLSYMEWPISHWFQEAESLELHAGNCCWAPGMHNLASVLK